MITEDYVSFETAKLLKEKWFDEPCVWVYDPYSASFAKSQEIIYLLGKKLVYLRRVLKIIV